MALRDSPQNKRVFSVVNEWKKSALKSDDSLITPGHEIWSTDNLRDFYDRLVSNPDESTDKTFFEKLELQLSDADDPVIQLAAEILLFYFLVAWQITFEKKRDSVNLVLSWMKQPPKIPDYIELAMHRGLINPGQAFNSYRPYYFEQIIEFMFDWKSLDQDSQNELLENPWDFKKFVNKKQIKAAIGQRNILMYFVHPESFEDITSETHKKEIVTSFSEYINDSDVDIDEQILQIRNALDKEYGYQFHFYHPPVRNRWLDDSRVVSYWLEKTIVHNRQDRIEGDYRLGKMLWSPQASESGSDIYKNMRALKNGDVVFHLIDNEEISGVSRVQNMYDDQFDGLPNTDWSDRPGYQVPLMGYQKLDPPLNRSEFLGNEEYQQALIKINNEHDGLFYDRQFNLNQGCYLTKLPDELVQLLNSCYENKFDKAIPYISIGNKWCVYVSNGAGNNYQIGKRELTWGWKENTKDTPLIKSGDGLTLVYDIHSDMLPIPPGFPRVSDVSDFSGVASEIVEGIITTNIYEDETEIWTDHVYPQRFRFEIINTHNNANFSDATYPENVVGAAKRSACIKGTPQLVGGDDMEPAVTPITSKYTIDDALDNIFMDREEFEEILTLWEPKKNIVLQGPPGTGKSFIAKRFAYALLQEEAKDRVKMIQFHQTYSYEDFMQGYRPCDGGFELKNGVFYRFVDEALKRPSDNFVFIIDEINRGNLSKIFGETMLLIESDKRGGEWSVDLTYSEEDSELFCIPENIYLLGMMNTADRSLAMVDYALRRRFAFIDMEPKINSDKFRQYLLVENNIDEEIVTKIQTRISELNNSIVDDKVDLGKGFAIGHSYFCVNDPMNKYDDEWYKRIIISEIAPLIKEYWFDNPDKVEQEIDKLLMD